MLTKLVNKVGISPSTATIAFDGNRQGSYPYATPTDMKGGLGIIDPQDWWHTGRPYGLPGTAAVYFPKKGSPEIAGADLNGLSDAEPPLWMYAVFAIGGLVVGYLIGKRS